MKVEIELPDDVVWLHKIQALILEDTLEHLLADKLIELVDGLKDS